MRENLTGFHPVRGFVDQVFILRQILERRMCQRNSFHLSCLSVRLPETEFALLEIFHPNSPREIMFFRVTPSHLSFFNFIIEMVMGIALSSFENNCNNICPGLNLSNLKYADNGGLLSEDSSKLQVFQGPLNDTSNFWMGFALSKCKMLFQDVIGSRPNLVLVRE